MYVLLFVLNFFEIMIFNNHFLNHRVKATETNAQISFFQKCNIAKKYQETKIYWYEILCKGLCFNNIYWIIKCYEHCRRFFDIFGKVFGFQLQILKKFVIFDIFGGLRLVFRANRFKYSSITNHGYKLGFYRI